MHRSLPLLILFALLISPTATAQVWEQLETPSGGSIDALARSGNSIIALQTFGGVYRSEDEGASWNFLTDALSTTAVFDMTSSPSGVLYVIGFQKLAISSDRGATWQSKRLQFVPASMDFATNGDLLIGSTGRIMRSSDEGENWTEIIPNPAVTYGYNVAVSANGTWFAGAYRSGFYRSTDEGATWTRLDGTMTNSDVYSVSALPQSTIIVGLGNTAWWSPDDGQNWERVVDLDSVNTFGIVAGNDGAWYAATTRGLAVSTNSGRSWSKRTTFGRLFGLLPTAFGILIAADGTLQTSIDAGANWWPSSDGMYPPTWTSLVVPNGESSLLVGGTETGGLYVSENNGGTWKVAQTGLPYGFTVLDISAASTDRIAVLTDNSYLITSDNGPAKWDVKALPNTGAQIQAISARNDGGILLGDGIGSVYRSLDWGATWQYSGRIELPASNVNIMVLRQDVFASGRPVYAATDRGLFRSDNDGTSWSEITPGGVRQPVMDIAVTPGASQPVRSVIAAREYEVFRSTDKGASWTSIIKTGSQEPILDILLTREGHVVCLTGTSMYAWRMDTESVSSKPVPEEALVIAGKDLGGRYYAATRLNGVYRTLVDILDVARLAPAAAITALQLTPNPFGPASTSAATSPVLHYTVAERTRVTVMVFDAAGRRVFLRDAGERFPGEHLEPIDLQGASAGSYTIAVATEAGMRSVQAILLR
ncbi:MAG: hypothetical protein M5R41_13325 [Bacteroidia bacterium]|nr:hypothetical protein [Bacteroidia bacterium]